MIKYLQYICNGTMQYNKLRHNYLQNICKIVVTLLFLTVPVLAGTFGNTQDAVDNTGTIEDDIRGSGFVCDSTATGDTLYAQLQNTDATARNVYGAIYRSSDSSFVDSTDWVSITAVDSAVWYAFPFSNSPALKADTSYVLLLWAAPGVGVCYLLNDYDQSPENGRRKYLQWSGNDWPATLSGFTFYTNITNHIYVKYTTSAGGGRKCNPPIRH